MAKTITVRLTGGPYEAHGRVFSELTFREPLAKDLDALGEVTEWQPSPAGRGMMLITHDDRIAAYRARLLARGEGLPTDADLTELTFADWSAVKDAILGFFRKAPSTDGAERKTS